MRIVFSALLVVAVAGCGKKKEADPKAEAKTVETTTTTKPSLNGEPVDTCALLTKDQIKAVIGADAADPKKYMEPAGSLLGECSWMAGNYMIQVHARPAGEFEGSVETMKTKKDIAGVGEKAVLTEAGMLVKIAGKPYFLQVLAAGDAKTDEEKEQKVTDIAKAAVANAK
jgi:Protein of unknown function (DUF3558)